jgi:chorismate-pyruvate lyase
VSFLANSQQLPLGAGRSASLLYPLSEFYKTEGIALPNIREISPDEMPEPYRGLLVHNRDMTPTLESAWGGKLHVRAVRHSRHESLYMRQSLLLLEVDEKVTAMGAISINLDRFPVQARRLILEQHVPLGGILRDHGIEHRCRPAAYFGVIADSIIGEALDVETGCELFGRQNVMWDAQEQVLAEVIEILPPRNPPHAAEREDGDVG